MVWPWLRTGARSVWLTGIPAICYRKNKIWYRTFRQVSDPDPLGLPDPDPDPLVRDTDTDPDPSITQAKIVRKTLIPTVLWLLYDFLSLKKDANVPSKSSNQKTIFLTSLRSLTNIAGSGSGSISHRYGSADPDPDQYFMDPQHWFQVFFFLTHHLFWIVVKHRFAINSARFLDYAGKTDACSASARSLENLRRAFGHQSSAPGSSASPTRQPMVGLSSLIGRLMISLSIPYQSGSALKPMRIHNTPNFLNGVQFGTVRSLY